MKKSSLDLKKLGFDIVFLRLLVLILICLLFQLSSEFLTPFIDFFLLILMKIIYMGLLFGLFIYFIIYLGIQKSFIVRMFALIISSLPFLLFFLDSFLLDQAKTSGFRFYLYLHSSVYSEIIEIENQKVISNKERDSPIRGVFKDIIYRVDRSEVVRIAFPVGGGISDNWGGIIYDPTGVVEQANWYSPPEIKKLFGGDLVGCVKIQKNFFHCGFT